MLGNQVVINQAQTPAPKIPAKTPAAKTAAAKTAAAKTAAAKAEEKIIAAKNQAYREHFDKALQAGQNDYKQYSDLNQVMLIDVDSFRKVVRPLPF